MVEINLVFLGNKRKRAGSWSSSTIFVLVELPGPHRYIEPLFKLFVLIRILNVNIAIMELAYAFWPIYSLS